MAPLSPSKYSLWDHTHFIPAFLPLFKTICKVYFWDHHQLPHYVLLLWNLLPFNDDFSFGKSQKSQGAKFGLWGGGEGWQTWVMRCFAKKILHESCRMGRRTVVMKLICSLGHSECDGHTVPKLSQRCLTADWLAPRESDCWRIHSKVSSDWLPSYINVTLPVLEIFKTAG
jgi:hypothetical protein